MTLDLNYKNGNTFTYKPSENQWWINGFKPQPESVIASNLTAVFKVYFKDNQEMYNAFINSQSYIDNTGKWKMDKDNPYLLICTYK